MFDPTKNFNATVTIKSPIPFIKRPSAKSSYTATPTSNSNCKTDKLCKGKSHEQYENH